VAAGEGRIKGTSDLKQQLEDARQELALAQRAGDYAKASELQYGRVPELEKRIQTPTRAVRCRRSGRAC